ncbi:type II secretion system protein J [Chloroflexota bacterium]
MIEFMLKMFRNNQRGFALMDLVIALAITGLISLGVTTSIVQLVKGSTYNRNQLTAIEQLQNVGRVISNDARMAQIVEGEEPEFPLTLKWTDYGNDGTDGDQHVIVYVYDMTENTLERQAYWYTGYGTPPPMFTVVATNVDLSETSWDLNEVEGTLTLEITSKAGTGAAQESETRTYEVDCKPLFTASVSGMKFDDQDADGATWEGEPGLDNWTIFVDYDDDDVLDANEPYDITDANGDYKITGIAPGVWKVKEVAQTGYTNHSPVDGYYEETFNPGDSRTGRNFGNH